jgi:beta-galactosidase
MIIIQNKEGSYRMTQSDYNKIKDPQFFKENVLPAHAALNLYADEKEAARGKSSLKQSASGNFPMR